ncbi:MAG: ABC transporter substrate-binding protein [Phormidesmis sp.]
MARDKAVAVKLSRAVSVLLCTALLGCAIAACKESTDHAAVKPTDVSSASSTNCRTIEHSFGETEVCDRPQRIVVLGNDILEYLLALDVQPVAYADYVSLQQEDFTQPEKQIPYLGNYVTHPLINAGTVFNPAVERIVQAEPDLIMGSQSQVDAGQYEVLSQIAPTLLFNYAETEDNLKKVAKAVNRLEQAEQTLMQTQQQIADAKAAFASLVETDPRVLLLVSSQLQEIGLANSTGLCSSLVESLGFELVSPPELEDNAGAQVPISIETLPQMNDANLVILLGSNLNDIQQFQDTESFETSQLSSLKQAWEENAIAQSLTASKAGKVYFIPMYLCRGLPGPIGTELYLEALQKQLLSNQSSARP